MNHIQITASKDTPWIRMSDFNKLQIVVADIMRKYDIDSMGTEGFKTASNDRYNEVKDII